MDAHNLLKAEGLDVESYGVGTQGTLRDEKPNPQVTTSVGLLLGRALPGLTHAELLFPSLSLPRALQ